jgi:hypothetical protein
MSDVLEVYDISTEAVQVVTQGPQGAQGATGPTGPAGSTTFGTTAGTATEGNDGRIATIGSGTITTNEAGGSINTSDGGGSIDLSNSGGSIDLSQDGGSINTSLSGGSINTAGTSENGAGGSINTSGDQDGQGGSIDTYGVFGSAGGSINTSSGGGSINTRGTGSIGLGVTGARTTLVGSATTDKTITLPNATGTVALNETFAAPPAIGGAERNSGAFTTLNATNGTITASAPVLDLAQTWNASGVAFTSLKLNVTATLAASSSLLADLQIGGAPVFSVARISSTAGNVGAWLYGVYSGAGANYERGFMRWSAATGTFQIGTEKLGTGGARALEFQTDGVTRMGISTGGTVGFGQQTGQSTALIGWSGNCFMRPINASAGVLTLLNAALDGFDRLQFGGTTNLFPALKRSSTTLQVRLADDSAFGPLSCGTFSHTGSLGFYGTVAVAQPASVGTAATGFTANGPTNTVHADSTFTGGVGTVAYNISDIVKHLKTLGLIAS